MQRQTSLSFEEICEKLKKNAAAGICGVCDSGRPEDCPGLMINELGVMAVDEGNKKAEARLREILEWPQEELRGIAYFYSVMIANPDEETANAIMAFAQGLENEEIIMKVDEAFRDGVIGRRSN